MSEVAGDIEYALSLLGELIDEEHVQTTHARLGPCEIEDVAAAMVAAYRNPSAYTVSDLRQSISGLLGANRK
jgi:hypothetical protein